MDKVKKFPLLAVESLAHFLICVFILGKPQNADIFSFEKVMHIMKATQALQSRRKNCILHIFSLKRFDTR